MPAHANADADAPAPWVRRFTPLIRASGCVLDCACGGGRHARWLAACGLRVLAVDRSSAALEALDAVDGVDTLEADLEGGPWPFAGYRFDAVVVTNYLYRPRLPMLFEAISPGGVLIYETFMRGNERFGRPSNPDFLLAPGELLERVAGAFSVVAFEQGEVAQPKAAVVQRICAVRGAAATARLPPP